MPVREISFSDLSTTDLIVDAVYKGELANNAGDDPIAKLLPCGNQGGFRFCGGTTLPSCRMAILFSTFSEPDWPDLLEPETGRFVYFGDNRRPGHELHETRGGNKLLRMCFEALHAGLQSRLEVPPFFVFSRGPERRDVQFKGLAVPGADGVPYVAIFGALPQEAAGRKEPFHRLSGKRGHGEYTREPVPGNGASRTSPVDRQRVQVVPQSSDQTAVGRVFDFEGKALRRGAVAEGPRSGFENQGAPAQSHARALELCDALGTHQDRREPDEARAGPGHEQTPLGTNCPRHRSIPSLAQGTRRSFPHNGYPRSRHGSPLQRAIRVAVA